MAPCAQTYLCLTASFWNRCIWCCCACQYKKPYYRSLGIEPGSYTRLDCSVLNKDRVENVRHHNKTTSKLRQRIIRGNGWRKADDIDVVRGKLNCLGATKWIFHCWEIELLSWSILLFWCFNFFGRNITLHLHLFQNFACGLYVECVHDLCFCQQLGIFLRNFKAFHVSKGLTLFP